MDFQKAFEVQVGIRKGENWYDFDTRTIWLSEDSEVLGSVEHILEAYDEPLKYRRFLDLRHNYIELVNRTNEKTYMKIEWKECRILVDKR